MKNFKQKGFTLIELLMVIAIIAILAAVVLTTVSSSRVKANKAAAIKTLKSVMPELLVCANDGGYAYSGTAPTAGSTICMTSSSNVTPYPGHTATWPNLTALGWSYNPPTGLVASDPINYIYSATKSSVTITCTVSNGVCQ